MNFQKTGILMLAGLWLIGTSVIFFEGLTTMDKRHDFWLRIMFVLWLAVPAVLMIIFP